LGLVYFPATNQVSTALARDFARPTDRLLRTKALITG
jgi:hypothetical protein